ncbi:MAG TPA: tetratricopeptide repeat protein [candidate division Zixibacteria bacterium]|nr:tetratricopeptide repeat protein [candidate division Zixibacteria bacterium]
MKRKTVRPRGQAAPTVRPSFCAAVLLAALAAALPGCSGLAVHDAEKSSDPFGQSRQLFEQGNYDAALRENQRLLADGRAAPDVALFNLGLISAYSSNPRKDYPKALGYFRRLIKEHPRSPLVEQAKVWVQVLEEHQKIAEERRRLIEERRVLLREKELLAQERERLNYTVERSRQVDIEIEKRRRQTRLR